MTQKNRYAGKRPRGRKPSKQDPFEEVRIFVPRWLMARLRTMSDIIGITVERLIVRALWNAKYRTDFWDIDLDLSNVGTNKSTAEEQSRIFQYLCAARNTGVELELLVMCYEDLEFVSHNQLKQALVDLIHLGLATLFNGGDGEVRIKAVIEGRTREKGFRLFGGEKL